MPRASLSLSSLPACLRLTGSVAVEASCLYISLSLPVSLTPPTLRCSASYPCSFFLPLPLTALTPSLYLPLLSPSLSLLPVTLLSSENPLSSPIFATLSFTLFPSPPCHSLSHPPLPIIPASYLPGIEAELVLLIPPLANVYPRDSPCLCSHLITPFPAQPFTIKCCLGYQRGFKGVGEDGSRKGWRRNSRGGT